MLNITSYPTQVLLPDSQHGVLPDNYIPNSDDRFTKPQI